MWISTTSWQLARCRACLTAWDKRSIRSRIAFFSDAVKIADKKIVFSKKILDQIPLFFKFLFSGFFAIALTAFFTLRIKYIELKIKKEDLVKKRKKPKIKKHKKR